MSKLRVDKIAAPIVEDEFTGSVFFDGSDYLEFAQSTDLSFGTGDYTVECWIHPREVTSNLEIVLNTGGKNNNTFYFHYDENQLSVGNQNAFISNQATVFENDTWYHIVAARQSGVLKLFRNGVQVGSDATDTTDWASGGTMRIGLNSDGSQGVNGYISNLRVCKGHAVYFSNFTPPTRQLVVHKAAPRGVVFSAADNVTTLLACQSATDATIDASGRHTLTVGGSAHAQSANPGLLRGTNISSTITENTGSVFFDGTGDYLDIKENGNDFDFDGETTIESWIYFETIPTNSWVDFLGTSNNSAYLGSGKSGWIAAYYTLTVTGLQFRLSYQSNSAWIFELGWNFTATAGQWYHVVYTRESGTIYCYVNGVKLARSTTSGTGSQSDAITSSEGILRVGGGAGSTAKLLTGYISNVRICKGHAVYKSANGNFAVPTRELEVHQGPEDDRTTLLCCHDGENIFADKSGRHIIAAYGDRTSSPTPTATDSPIGITTHNPGLTRNVDLTAGPTFQGGVGYTSQNWLTLPKGTTTERFVEVANNAVSASSARGLFLGGSSPTQRNTIDYITIPTAGNAKDFGDLTASHQYVTSVSSNTRGVNGGGDPTTNIIDYVTISTLGNAKDFGDLFTGRYGTGGCSSGIRGVWAGGFPGSGNVNTIDFVTIASTGNANDFGDLTAGKGYVAGCGSPSRGLFAGGLTPTKINTIEFITIATTGNAFDFGDLTSVRAALSGCSSSTRGVFVGGNTPTMVNIIDYVAIPTTGNAVDFGDQSVTRENVGACSSKTRGVFGGGNDPSNTKLNTIDFVEFATLGDATDFGDLTQNRKGIAGCSNGHGGLG